MGRTIANTATETFGAVTTTVQTVDVTDYNHGGESFEADDAKLYRFLHVSVEVADGTPVVAQYDRSVGGDDEGVIRLYRQSNDGGGTANEPLSEVPDSANLDAELEVTCYGK